MRMWKPTRGCCEKMHFWSIKCVKRTKQDCFRKATRMLFNLFTVGDLKQSFYEECIKGEVSN